MGLSEREPFRCVEAADCDVFNALLGDVSCETYRCEAETGQCVPSARDDDGDGFAPQRCGGRDCDDLDPDRSPLGLEACNGVDDDCDGLLDGLDEDDDGDGAADLCAGAEASDCHDDPGASPELARRTFRAAVEVCDGYDNDCLINGEYRSGGGARAAPSEDLDGDGHASVDASCLGACLEGCACCSAACDDCASCPDCCLEGVHLGCPEGCPEGDCHPGCPDCFIKDDCDDRDDEVHPGALELCDGLDNDCDGVIDDAGGATAGSACLPQELAAGGMHTCQLNRNSSVVCWGSNQVGQLGDTHALDGDAVIVQELTDVEQIRAGAQFTCALTSDRRVTCWGDGALVRPGISDYTADFGQIAAVGEVRQISAGFQHACAVLRSGEVLCWGRPDGGEVFAGAATGDESVGATVIPGVSDAVQVDAGLGVSCAVGASGFVSCWGDGRSGSLGEEGGTDEGVFTIAGIDDALEVACGDHFCCVIRGEADRSLWCWGANMAGQLGCDPGECGASSSAPVEVAGGDDGVGRPQAVRAGVGAHLCVLTSVGADATRLRCWGDNSHGQLGLGLEVSSSSVPVDLGVAEGVTVGWRHSCAQRADGVECFGFNLDDQLGRGLPAASPPYAVDWPSPVSVTAAPLQTADRCFLLRDRHVRCPRGAGRDPGVIDDAVAITGPSITSDLGLRPRCVVVERAGGTGVRCFAASEEEDRGITGMDGEVVGLSDAQEVACGEAHCCALSASGLVTCWGSNASGQLGQGETELEVCGTTPCSRVPRMVDLPGEAAQVVVGRSHSCARLTGGDVACWGSNNQGQVGATVFRPVRSPSLLASLPADDAVVELAAAVLGDVTCALLQSGGVLCWGAPLAASDDSGPDPRSIAELEQVSQIALTSDALCARRVSGSIQCPGELGLNPERIYDAVDLGCGPAHCCLTRSSGQSVCWGTVPAGLVGAGGEVVITPTPQPVVDLLGGGSDGDD